MEFTTIYHNGKPQRFFIKVDTPREFAVIQPYFISTNIDHPRHGRILEMSCLFSSSVWQGRQIHGYGYSPSADVYGELIRIITELHKHRLTEQDKNELQRINTHEDKQTFSAELLEHLSQYNSIALDEMYNLRG